METITIRAASYESARGIVAALSDFPAELVTRPDGFCEVVINLSEVEIVAVLNTLADHVTARADGPARLDMNGNSYVMYPAGNAA
jgi:hypothetical protein